VDDLRVDLLRDHRQAGLLPRQPRGRCEIAAGPGTTVAAGAAGRTLGVGRWQTIAGRRRPAASAAISPST
jgi:hypothetical protein